MRSGVPVGIGLPLMGSGWALLWTQDTFWNPLFFMGMWSGATLLMYGLGERGYPGLRHHLALLGLSMPLWWWFEVVNGRVGNWEYLGAAGRYSRWEYILMGSAAFSTVIPALDAAWGLTVKGGRSAVWVGRHRDTRRYGIQIGLGMLFQAMVFVWPRVFYPLVWVAPFLILDGLVGYQGGRSLVDDMMGRRWRLVVGVAMGGLVCGFLWEFWNFWSVPKWIYHVPLLGFGHVFEMPILGYGGYVPFAWSIYQMLRLGPVRPSTGSGQVKKSRIRHMGGPRPRLPRPDKSGLAMTNSSQSSGRAVESACGGQRKGGTLVSPAPWYMKLRAGYARRLPLPSSSPERPFSTP